MSLVDINNFNELIDNKSFFDQPVERKQETYEKLAEMSKNDDYMTRNLLNYFYHRSCYKLISIDTSRQKKSSILQQINFTRKLKNVDGAEKVFIAKKQQKTILKFSLDSLDIT